MERAAMTSSWSQHRSEHGDGPFRLSGGEIEMEARFVVGFGIACLFIAIPGLAHHFLVA